MSKEGWNVVYLKRIAQNLSFPPFLFSKKKKKKRLIR